ncbi:hypothetical protein DFH09DRAFT_1312285 [Mycena vulgaris]|nr:hypothetical protein DFH09DRAFT_1312285 [Mycena vulgaris]
MSPPARPRNAYAPLDVYPTPFAASYSESPRLKIKLARASTRHNEPEYEPEDG